jgi:transposase InsO family protein
MDQARRRGHPANNGICERFHRTLQDELYTVAFRKQVYTMLEELQTDVDEWLEPYHRERNPHRQGLLRAEHRCKHCARPGT